MQLSNWIARNSSLSWAELFHPQTGAVRLAADGAGNVSIAQWDATRVGIPQPDATQLAAIAAMPEAQPVAALKAYLGQSFASAIAAGITVNVAASGQPAINVLCDGTTDTKADLANLYDWGTANPSATQNWLDNNGVSTSLTGAQYVTLKNAVQVWVGAMYGDYATQLAAIVANATTTTAQIDAIIWPKS